MSLLLLFFLRPCRKSLPVPGMRHFTFLHAIKFWPLVGPLAWLQGPAFSGMGECKRLHSRDRKPFPAFGIAKYLLPGTWRGFCHGECKKDLWMAGKIFWYQQRDCQSMVKECSDGKLKQKPFFTVWILFYMKRLRDLKSFQIFKSKIKK